MGDGGMSAGDGIDEALTDSGLAALAAERGDSDGDDYAGLEPSKPNVEVGVMPDDEDDDDLEDDDDAELEFDREDDDEYDEDDSPFADVDPMVREWAERKGFRSLEDAAFAGANLERLYGDQASELGELRRKVEAIEQGAYQQPQDDDDPPFIEQLPQVAAMLARQVDSGDKEIGLAMFELTQAFQATLAQEVGKVREDTLAEVAEQVAPRLDPIEQDRWQQHFEQSTLRVQKAYGEDTFSAIAPEAQAIIRERATRNPDLLNDPNFIAEAFESAYARHSFRERSRRDADVAPASGRGSRPRRRNPVQDQVNTVVAAIDKVSAGGSGGIL